MALYYTVKLYVIVIILTLYLDKGNGFIWITVWVLLSVKFFLAGFTIDYSKTWLDQNNWFQKHW